MFMVEVGSLLTTVLAVLAYAGRLAGASRVHPGGIGVALADGAVRQLRRGDGRGAGQGPGRYAAQRPARCLAPRSSATRRTSSTSTTCPASSLRKGDIVLVHAGQLVPGDGEIIEGVASVDESAITGESAPVIRESGGDRSAVTGGTKVLSDWIIVRISANPGESFLDRMIGLIEAAKRQKTPNEIALEILLAGLTIIFLVTTVTLSPFSIFAVARPQVRGPRSR